jgi:hypothetical protein
MIAEVDGRLQEFRRGLARAESSGAPRRAKPLRIAGVVLHQRPLRGAPTGPVWGEAFSPGSGVSLEDVMNTRRTAAMFAVSAALAIGGATFARAEDVTTTRTVDRPAGDVTTTRTVDKPMEGRAADDCATHSMTRTNDATDKTVTRTNTNCR